MSFSKGYYEPDFYIDPEFITDFEEASFLFMLMPYLTDEQNYKNNYNENVQKGLCLTLLQQKIEGTHTKIPLAPLPANEFLCFKRTIEALQIKERSVEDRAIVEWAEKNLINFDYLLKIAHNEKLYAAYQVLLGLATEVKTAKTLAQALTATEHDAEPSTLIENKIMALLKKMIEHQSVRRYNHIDLKNRLINQRPQPQYADLTLKDLQECVFGLFFGSVFVFNIITLTPLLASTARNSVGSVYTSAFSALGLVNPHYQFSVMTIWAFTAITMLAFDYIVARPLIQGHRNAQLRDLGLIDAQNMYTHIQGRMKTHGTTFEGHINWHNPQSSRMTDSEKTLFHAYKVDLVQPSCGNEKAIVRFQPRSVSALSNN